MASWVSPPLKLTFCLRKWWLEDEPWAILPLWGFGFFSVPMLVLGRVTFLAVCRDCTTDFSREYNQPFFSRIFGSLWTVRRISWNVRVLLPLLLPLLWSQEMLEEGNVSIVEYGQELPSDTTTETPETTAKTTVSTTQRVPWKVQAGPRSKVGKWKFGLNHFLLWKGHCRLERYI